MKKIIAFLFFFIAMAGITFAQNAAPKDSASFKFSEETWDFGEIPQGTPVTHSFEFTNTGKVPLAITTVDKSCGCTTPKWTLEPVAPGKKGFVSATFNAAGAGEFNKNVTIHSNAKQANKMLFIKGKVVAKPAVSEPVASPPKH